MKEPTLRFSDRVENYVKYRPGYPPETIKILKEDCSLSPDWKIADIGSGTGIFTRLLLENKNEVYGIEPNMEMRKEAENTLKAFPNFISVDATSEMTTLSAGAVDMITAAQAFHWFKKDIVRIEFERILKDNGWVVLIWNSRNIETDFENEYEKLLLKYSKEYPLVGHKNKQNSDIDSFYLPGSCTKKELKNSQLFDLEGLKGRLLSSSYAPTKDEEIFIPMMKELERLFNKYNNNGLIAFNYSTEIYYGKFRL